MDYMMVLYFFVMFVMNAALLRQLNQERLERKETMDRFEKLAVTVRYAQLQQEMPETTTLPDWNFAEPSFAPRGRASVADVEGE
jgi:hypothetical protein